MPKLNPFSRSRCFIGNGVRSAHNRIAILTSIHNCNCGLDGANDAVVTVHRIIFGSTSGNDHDDQNKQVPGASNDHNAGVANVSLIREYTIPLPYSEKLSEDYTNIQLSLSPSGNILSIQTKYGCYYDNGDWTFYDLSKPIPRDDGSQERDPTVVFDILATSDTGVTIDGINSISYTLDNELIVQWEDRERMERFLRLGENPEMDYSLWELIPQEQPRQNIRGRHRLNQQRMRRLKTNTPFKKLPKAIANRIIFIVGRPKIPRS